MDFGNGAEVDVCAAAEGDGRCPDGLTRLWTEHETRQRVTGRLFKTGNWSRFVCWPRSIASKGTESGVGRSRSGCPNNSSYDGSRPFRSHQDCGNYSMRHSSYYNSMVS